MLQGNVVDQFHDDHGLADPRPAEKADLAAFQIGLDEVDDLDPGLQNLGLGGLLIERRRVPMDREALGGLDGTPLVDRIAQHVQHAAENLRSHGNGNRMSGVLDPHPTHHAVGGLHGDRPHAPLAEVLLDLAGHVERIGHVKALAGHADGAENPGELAGRELNVNGRSGDLNHFPYDWHLPASSIPERDPIREPRPPIRSR